MRYSRFALPLVAVPVLLLAACGLSSGSARQQPNSARPSSVRITSELLTVDPQSPSTVTVDSSEKTGALYDAAFALPTMPTQQACPAIAGPRYSLSFLSGDQVVLNATADRGGCPSVTIGTGDVRQANEAFWHLLDQDIADATPAAKTDAVTIVVFDGSHSPVTAAHIASAAQSQALYDAMNALSVAPANQVCPDIAGPRYELAFTSGTDTLRASVSRSGCGTVQLGQGSSRQPDDTFWQTFTQVLAGTTLSAAVPNRLDVKMEPAKGSPSGTASATTLQGQQIIQQLYDATYALPSLSSSANCPSVAGPEYGLTFSTAEGIELVSVIADKGGCGTVTFYQSDVRKASGAFWDLLQQAVPS